MQNKTKYWALAIIAFALFTVSCMAQVVTNDLPPIPTIQIPPGTEGLLLQFIAQHVWYVAALAFVGALRSLFKPCMTWLESDLKANRPEAYARLIVIESSPIYKGICWIVDYLASVKLPMVKPPQLVIIGFLSLCFVGCTSLRQEAVSDSVTHNKDGTISTNHMSIKVGLQASGNAKQALESLRVSAGKTASAGLAGASQESTLSDLIDSLTKMIEAGGKKAVAP